jgi:hypothetical protein
MADDNHRMQSGRPPDSWRSSPTCGLFEHGIRVHPVTFESDRQRSGGDGLYCNGSEIVDEVLLPRDGGEHRRRVGRHQSGDCHNAALSRHMNYSVTNTGSTTISLDGE